MKYGTTYNNAFGDALLYEQKSRNKAKYADIKTTGNCFDV